MASLILLVAVEWLHVHSLSVVNLVPKVPVQRSTLMLWWLSHDYSIAMNYCYNMCIAALGIVDVLAGREGLVQSDIAVIHTFIMSN